MNKLFKILAVALIANTFAFAEGSKMTQMETYTPDFAGMIVQGNHAVTANDSLSTLIPGLDAIDVSSYYSFGAQAGYNLGESMRFGMAMSYSIKDMGCPSGVTCANYIVGVDSFFDYIMSSDYFPNGFNVYFGGESRNTIYGQTIRFDSTLGEYSIDDNTLHGNFSVRMGTLYKMSELMSIELYFGTRLFDIINSRELSITIDDTKYSDGATSSGASFINTHKYGMILNYHF